jgi:hypothetical protein
MDLNIKLQGLKYNYEKVQGCFCKILRFQRFLGFMELFSLRKIHRICPRYRGPGPLAPAHGSTNFNKCRSLASESTTQIKPSESVSRLLISAVHHRSDGWLGLGAVRAHTRGGASRRGRAWRFTEVRVFSSYGGQFSMRFAPLRSHQRGERVYANLNRWRAATEPDNGEAALSVLGDSEGGLR